MKKLFIATTIALSLTVAFNPSASAGSYSKDPEQKKVEKTNEMIGFGTGALAGAAVGGPLGAFVGGIVGIFLADDVNDTQQLANVNKDLAQANHSLAQQRNSIIALQGDLHKSQQQQMIQLATYSEQPIDIWLNEISNFETNLQFKTASFVIEDTYKSQLNSLASLLKTYPQLTVKLTGFADNRGDSHYNKRLSEQRAQAVEQYLLSEDVKSSQVSVVGEGETTLTPAQTNTDEATANMSIEDLFFARKVNVRLIPLAVQMTAAN